jgi:hypothetical protein
MDLPYNLAAILAKNDATGVWTCIKSKFSFLKILYNEIMVLNPLIIFKLLWIGVLINLYPFCDKFSDILPFEQIMVTSKLFCSNLLIRGSKNLSTVKSTAHN